ncbi:MAG TPA: hypothetical protein VGD67_05025, partial [Pseudonocardiaceae bacterium]
MLWVVLGLVLVSFGLLVVALVTSRNAWAWGSVTASAVAAGVLAADWLGRRRHDGPVPDEAQRDPGPEPAEPPADATAPSDDTEPPDGTAAVASEDDGPGHPEHDPAAEAVTGTERHEHTVSGTGHEDEKQAGDGEPPARPITTAAEAAVAVAASALAAQRVTASAATVAPPAEP